ncbi:unnamed protein product [Cylicocyclus nassatus]|uniref:Uncharacterized protein n=1 Tax=Cylicocyclus nassatus TaxID=53992 RepID=A0AA36M3I6_CYLNA|nr:unnamed protein product [Cylicocyclus nassatus]
MLTSKTSDIKINMQHVKNMQVNALLSKLREQDKELKRSFHVAKNREKSLPKGCSLQRSNISRVWHLGSAPPFKGLNMIEVMEKWQRPKRAHMHDHFLQSGKKGKFDHFKDLPEGLVDFLISFVLDALGLYRDELLRTPDEHKRTSLAEDDDGREQLFNVLSEKRVVWSDHARIAIGRALADIRTYHFDLERSALHPSKKKRVVIEDSEGRSTGTTQEDLVIQKTECVEDEVEDIEEA